MPGYGGSSSVVGIEMEKYTKRNENNNRNENRKETSNDTKERFMDIMSMDMSHKMNLIIILLGLLVAMKIHACLKKSI